MKKAFKETCLSDGSCLNHWRVELTRAAWALIEMNAVGDMIAYLRGPAWSNLIQSSPSAEYVAAGAFAQTAGKGATLVTDYSGDVGVAAATPSSWRKPGNIHAGTKQHINQQAGWHQ